MIIRVWKYTIMIMAAVLMCTAVVLLLAVPVVMIVSSVTGDETSFAELGMGIVLSIILYPAFIMMGYTLLKWRKDEIAEIEDNNSKENSPS